MPILSSVLERMGYSYLVCRDQPRGVPSVDPSTLGGISPYVTRLPQVLLQLTMHQVVIHLAYSLLSHHWQRLLGAVGGLGLGLAPHVGCHRRGGDDGP